MQEEILKYLVGLLTFGISQKRLKDRKVFDRLIGQLPPSSSAILLLKDHDMGAPFRHEIMNPLYDALTSWNNVDNIFQTKGIEKRKNEFLDKLREFTHRFSDKSGEEGGGFISIGMKDYEDRVDMIKYRDTLNRLGTEAYEKYNEFYNFAHRKLPV